MSKQKLIRITTVPLSLEKLLEGQLNYMSKEYDVLAISSDEKELTRLGKMLGIPTRAVDMTREITPGRDIAAVYELYRIFKKEKPLIVHTHTPKAGIAGMMAAKLAGVPLRLHTVAGLPLLEAKGGKKKVLEYVEKVTFACATKVYPNSKKICEYLKEHSFTSPEKLKVIGKGSSNGIDTDFFDPNNFSATAGSSLREEIGIPQKDVVFVFVGRLVGDKGINELVSAFVRLQEKEPDTSLLLVGPYEQKLDPLKDTTLERMKSHPKIFETGYQEDVRPYLACSDVLAFPSYREGFPNVVMQAGSMGLPAIVTDINGCNEIIQEDVNGFIVPVRDEEALLERMNVLLSDKEKRNRMGEKSRKLIKDNYKREEVWKALMEEYKQLEKVVVQN